VSEGVREGERGREGGDVPVISTHLTTAWRAGRTATKRTIVCGGYIHGSIDVGM